MRKLFILTILISSFMMSSIAHAEWTKVSQTVSGDKLYVDFTRIKQSNGRIYFWQLMSYSKPSQFGDQSSMVFYEVECEPFRFKYLADSYYPSPMAKGNPSTENNQPDKNWRYPKPKTSSESVLKTVCNHKSMQ